MNDVLSPSAPPGLFSMKWITDPPRERIDRPGLAKTKPVEYFTSVRITGFSLHSNRSEKRSAKSKKGGPPTYEKKRKR